MNKAEREAWEWMALYDTEQQADDYNGDLGGAVLLYRMGRLALVLWLVWLVAIVTAIVAVTYLNLPILFFVASFIMGVSFFLAIYKTRTYLKWRDELKLK